MLLWHRPIHSCLMDSCFWKSYDKFVVKLNLKCVISDQGWPRLRMGADGQLPPPHGIFQIMPYIRSKKITSVTIKTNLNRPPPPIQVKIPADISWHNARNRCAVTLVYFFSRMIYCPLKVQKPLIPTN